MPPSLLERSRKLRLPVRHLATRASVDEDAAHACLKGRADSRKSTVEAIDNAIRAEEIEMLDYLLALYPKRQSSGGEATPTFP